MVLVGKEVGLICTILVSFFKERDGVIMIIVLAEANCHLCVL